MLTFELEPDGSQLHVHASRAGMRQLISELQMMLAASTQQHTHLMTPDWGGAELTSQTQGENTVLLHKVTVHFWPASE